MSPIFWMVAFYIETLLQHMNTAAVRNMSVFFIVI